MKLGIFFMIKKKKTSCGNNMSNIRKEILEHGLHLMVNDLNENRNIFDN
jgi:hypothetical protein